MSERPGRDVAAVHAAMARVDDAFKALASGAQPGVVRERIARRLDVARELLGDVADPPSRRALASQLARRAADLDRAALDELLVATPGVAPAPTHGVDPARVPPGQHLTPGWPVLHVGSVPRDTDPELWQLTLTGRVRERLRWTVSELATRFPVVRPTTDLHCVTRWSRLDNRWEGVRLVDLVDAAVPRPEATHLIASGHPAYSAELDLAAVVEPEPVAAGSGEVVVAWNHDGAPLDVAHGGPLRLVVPSRYGWKSVKWLTEIRLVERPVPGYWEERGYHNVGDPWREQRFIDDVDGEAAGRTVPSARP